MFTEELNTAILNLQANNAFTFVLKIAQNFIKVPYKTVSQKLVMSVMCMYLTWSVRLLETVVLFTLVKFEEVLIND